MVTFFVLQPPWWTGVDTHLCRPLLGRRAPTPKMPWVAIARGTRYGAIELVRRDRLDRAEACSLIAAANDHLLTCRRTWNVALERGVFRKEAGALRLVMPDAAIGLTADPMDDLSSEQLLNPVTLVEAGLQVGSRELIAIIPKRGWLVILPCQPGELPQMQIAHQIAHATYSRAGADALSTYGFFVEAGHLTGVSVEEQGGGYVSMLRPSDDEWLLPPERPRRTVAATNPAERAVLDILEHRDPEPVHWRTLGLLLGPIGHDLPAVLRALAARGVIEQATQGSWRIATPSLARRSLHTGATLHRIAVQLPASAEWQDTGLQPDVLASRPLLAGYSMRLLWQARVHPGVEILPIIHLRHVPDEAQATHDPTFQYHPPADAPPVVASFDEVRVTPSSTMRFPSAPGRIEARIAGASGPTELFAVAGTIRLELLAPRAGVDDAPVRAPLELGLVVGSNEFPELPRLPEIVEPIAWHEF